MELLTQLIKAFDIETTKLEPYGGGHINDTYLVTKNGKKMILQRLNTNIFKNPEHVMSNIMGITEHMRKKIEKHGGDPARETMTVVPTVNGNSHYITENGDCYRVYEFIDDTFCINRAETPEQMTSAAKVLGEFYHMLRDYPAHTLFETIKNFHNTRNYYNRLCGAYDNDAAGRAKDVKEEFEFAKKCEKYVDIITTGLEEGTIPLRVTHNDTKLNNIMFDNNTRDAICVIDLDTVMPGSILFDFGDAMRFGASSGAEDEKDLSKIWFDLEMFEAFTKGFAMALKTTLTENEVKLLATSVKILTLECGMRFLEDYLKGDTYFKISYNDHNLVRARTQFKLVADMEEKTQQMEDIVRKYFA